MEKETYTLLKYVVGSDYSRHTAIEFLEMRLHKESTVSEMVSAFKRFMLAIGYSKENLDKYIEDD